MSRFPFPTLRATPGLLRAGFASIVAYRAELFVWMLTTNLPLVMLAVWSAAAREGPIQGFGQRGFAAYYLTALCVRQLTGCWVVWEITMEIRNGTLSLRLLKPVHPLLAHAAENLAAFPLRALMVMPIAAVLVAVGHGELSHDPVLWLLAALAGAGAWLLTFLVMCTVGCLAFWFESAQGLFQGWLGLFSIFSGYLLPLKLFPHAIQRLALWAPFRFQLSIALEMMLGQVDRAQAAGLLAAQAAYLGLFFALTAALWRAGVRRYEAFGA